MSAGLVDQGRCRRHRSFVAGGDNPRQWREPPCAGYIRHHTELIWQFLLLVKEEYP